jgi:hypothetical protein
MPIKPIDTLLALKALCIAPRLNSNQRRVGAALIEHYNRRTGQCDPGHGRLAKLLSVDKRTAIRATQALVAHGLFEKLRHGGKSNRNFYIPVWSRFREICTVWNEKLKNPRSAPVTEMPPAERQACQLASVDVVTQTYQSNLRLITCESLPTKETDVIARSPAVSPPRSKGPRPVDAALAAAERRWNAALHDQFSSSPDVYGQAIGAIDQEMQAAATAAEMYKHGAGIKYILERLRAQGLEEPLRSAYAE